MHQASWTDKRIVMGQGPRVGGLLPAIYLTWAARGHGQDSLWVPPAASQHLSVQGPSRRHPEKCCLRGPGTS